MSISPARWFVALACLALLLGGVRTGSAWAAKKKPAKSWPGKKKHGHKKHAPASGPSKTGGAAPAEDADEEGEESAEDEAQDASKKPAGGNDAAKAKPKSVAKSDSDEKDDKDDDGEKSDDDGDSTVVHKKARRVAEKDEDEDRAAPIAFELSAGPRAVHRTFDFNNPLSNYQMVPKPFAYQLPAGPAPFIQLGLYPAAFATRGFASNFGLVGSFEKLLATKTNGETTLGQQFDAGLRFRLPLGASEVGLTGGYGQHSFHITSVDPGPGPNGVVPNVDYKFIRVGADARVRVSAFELGLHVGTRLVRDTGSLQKTWFPSTKTNSIEAGLSFAYRLTPIIGVVAGADFLRYAFDFNPVPVTNGLVAGGAVDQYISGFAALRVSISGG